MNAADLAERRSFDFRVVTAMAGPTFACEAYRDGDDLEARRRPISDPALGAEATAYRFIYDVPTLIGPGRFSARTEIGVGTAVADYPRAEPRTWIISKDVPWSPHFKRGAPVCIGAEFWRARRGHVSLGELVVHLARLLNWDEKGRGGGYVGWNGEAIAYHRRTYGSAALNPDLVYPTLPSWIYGTQGPALEFSVLGASAGAPQPGLTFEVRV